MADGSKGQDDDSSAGDDAIPTPGTPGADRPKNKHASTVASRAGKRKVDLGSSATAAPKARIVSRAPRPLWRRGSFWFAIIVLEALIALAISFVVTAPTLDDIPLDGVDVAALCPLVLEFRSNPISELTTENASAYFRYQADGYRKLVAVSPESIRGDLEHLASLTDELVATADAAAERKKTDPSFTGALSDISAKEGEIAVRGQVSSERVTNVLGRACGLDLIQETKPVGTTPPGANPSGSVPQTAPPPGSVPPTLAPDPSGPTDPTPPTSEGPIR